MELTDADRAAIERERENWRRNRHTTERPAEEALQLLDESVFRAGMAAMAEKCAQTVERKLFDYAGVRECVAAIRALAK